MEYKSQDVDNYSPRKRLIYSAGLLYHKQFCTSHGSTPCFRLTAAETYSVPGTHRMDVAGTSTFPGYGKRNTRGGYCETHTSITP